MRSAQNDNLSIGVISIQYESSGGIGLPCMITLIKGAQAQAAIAADRQRILTLLAMVLRPHEPIRTTTAWLNFMRGAEEVINYQFALSPGLFSRVCAYTFLSSETRLDDLAD